MQATDDGSVNPGSSIENDATQHIDNSNPVLSHLQLPGSPPARRTSHVLSPSGLRPVSPLDKTKLVGSEQKHRQTKLIRMDHDVRCLCRVSGSKLWVATRDGSVYIRDAASGKVEGSVFALKANSSEEEPTQVNAMIAHRGVVWTGSSKGELRGFSREGDKQLTERLDHSAAISSICAHGDFVITGSQDFSVNIRTAADGTVVKKLASHVSWVQDITVVYADSSRVEKQQELDADPTRVTAHTGVFEGLEPGSSNPNDVQLWSVGDDGIRVWNSLGESIALLKGHDAKSRRSSTAAFTLTPRGSIIDGSPTHARSISVRSTDSQLSVASNNNSTADIKSRSQCDVGVLCVKQVGDTVWTGGVDGHICVWSVETRKLLRRFSAHNRPVIALCRVGEFVWSTSTDRTIKVWDTLSFELDNVIDVKPHTPFNVLTNRHRVLIGCRRSAALIFFQVYTKRSDSNSNSITSPDAASPMAAADNPRRSSSNFANMAPPPPRRSLGPAFAASATSSAASSGTAPSLTPSLVVGHADDASAPLSHRSTASDTQSVGSRVSDMPTRTPTRTPASLVSPSPGSSSSATLYQRLGALTTKNAELRKEVKDLKKQAKRAVTRLDEEKNRRKALAQSTTEIVAHRDKLIALIKKQTKQIETIKLRNSKKVRTQLAELQRKYEDLKRKYAKATEDRGYGPISVEFKVSPNSTPRSPLSPVSPIRQPHSELERLPLTSSPMTIQEESEEDARSSVASSAASSAAASPVPTSARKAAMTDSPASNAPSISVIDEHGHTTPAPSVHDSTKSAAELAQLKADIAQQQVELDDAKAEILSLSVQLSESKKELKTLQLERQQIEQDHSKQIGELNAALSTAQEQLATAEKERDAQSSNNDELNNAVAEAEAKHQAAEAAVHDAKEKYDAQLSATQELQSELKLTQKQLADANAKYSEATNTAQQLRHQNEEQSSDAVARAKHQAELEQQLAVSQAQLAARSDELKHSVATSDAHARAVTALRAFVADTISASESDLSSTRPSSDQVQTQVSSIEDLPLKHTQQYNDLIADIARSWSSSDEANELERQQMEATAAEAAVAAQRETQDLSAKVEELENRLHQQQQDASDRETTLAGELELANHSLTEARSTTVSVQSELDAAKAQVQTLLEAKHALEQLRAQHAALESQHQGTIEELSESSKSACELQDQNSKLQSQNDAIVREKEHLDNELSAAREELARSEAAIRTLETQLGAVENELKNATDASNSKERKLEESQKSLASAQQARREADANTQKKLQALQSQVRDLKSALSQQKDSLSEKERELDSLHKARDRLNQDMTAEQQELKVQHEAAVASLHAKLKSVGVQLSDEQRRAADSESQAAAMLQQHSDELKTSQQQIAVLEKSLGESRTELASLQSKLAEQQDLNASHSAHIDELNTSLHSLQTQYDTAVASHSAVDANNADKLTSIAAELKGARESLSAAEAEHKIRASEHDSAVSALQVRISELEKEVSDADTALKTAKAASRKFSKQRSKEHKKSSARIADLETEIEQLGVQVEQNEAELAELKPQAQQTEKLAQQLQTLRAELEASRNALEQAEKANEDSVSELRALVDELNSQLSAKEAALAAAHEEHKAVAATLQTEHDSVSDEKTRLEAELREAQQEGEKMSVLSADLSAKLTEKNKNMETLVSEHKTALASLQSDLDAAATEKAGLEAELESLRSTANCSSKEAATLAATIAEKESELTQLAAEYKSATATSEATLTAVTEERDALSSELVSAKLTEKKLSERISDLSAAVDQKNKALEEQSDEHSASVEQLERTIDSLRSAKASLEAELETLRSASHSSSQQSAALAGELAAKDLDMTKQANDHMAETKHLQAQLDAASTEKSRLEAELQAAIGASADSSNSLVHASDEISDLKAQIASLEQTLTRRSEMLQQHQAAMQEQTRAASAQEAASAQRIAELAQQVSSLRADTAESTAASEKRMQRIQTQKQSLEQQLAVNQNKLALAESQVASQQQALTQQQAETDRLQCRIQVLSAEYSEANQALEVHSAKSAALEHKISAIKIEHDAKSKSAARVAPAMDKGGVGATPQSDEAGDSPSSPSELAILRRHLSAEQEQRKHSERRVADLESELSSARKQLSCVVAASAVGEAQHGSVQSAGSEKKRLQLQREQLQYVQQELQSSEHEKQRVLQRVQELEKQLAVASGASTTDSHTQDPVPSPNNSGMSSNMNVALSVAAIARLERELDEARAALQAAQLSEQRARERAQVAVDEVARVRDELTHKSSFADEQRVRADQLQSRVHAFEQDAAVHAKESADTSAERDQLTAQVYAQQSRIGQLAAELDSAQQQVSSLEAKIRDGQSGSDDQHRFRTELRQIQDRADSLSEQLNTAQRQIDQDVEVIEQLQTQLDQARASQVHSGFSPRKTVPASESKLMYAQPHAAEHTLLRVSPSSVSSVVSQSTSARLSSVPVVPHVIEVTVEEYETSSDCSLEHDRDRTALSEEPQQPQAVLVETKLVGGHRKHATVQRSQAGPGHRASRSSIASISSIVGPAGGAAAAVLAVPVLISSISESSEDEYHDHASDASSSSSAGDQQQRDGEVSVLHSVDDLVPGAAPPTAENSVDDSESKILYLQQIADQRAFECAGLRADLAAAAHRVQLLEASKLELERKVATGSKQTKSRLRRPLSINTDRATSSPNSLSPPDSGSPFGGLSSLPTSPRGFGLSSQPNTPRLDASSDSSMFNADTLSAMRARFGYSPSEAFSNAFKPDASAPHVSQMQRLAEVAERSFSADGHSFSDMKHDAASESSDDGLMIHLTTGETDPHHRILPGADDPLNASVLSARSEGIPHAAEPLDDNDDAAVSVAAALEAVETVVGTESSERSPGFWWHVASGTVVGVAAIAGVVYWWNRGDSEPLLPSPAPGPAPSTTVIANVPSPVAAEPMVSPPTVTSGIATSTSISGSNVSSQSAHFSARPPTVVASSFVHGAMGLFKGASPSHTGV
jgi:chromosome segregation ATPase